MLYMAEFVISWGAFCHALGHHTARHQVVGPVHTLLLCIRICLATVEDECARVAWQTGQHVLPADTYQLEGGRFGCIAAFRCQWLERQSPGAVQLHVGLLAANCAHMNGAA